MLADSQELGDKVVSYSREAIPRLTRDTNTALAKTPKLRKPNRAMAVGTPKPSRKTPERNSGAESNGWGDADAQETPDGGRADRMDQGTRGNTIMKTTTPGTTTTRRPR